MDTYVNAEILEIQNARNCDTHAARAYSFNAGDVRYLLAQVHQDLDVLIWTRDIHMHTHASIMTRIPVTCICQCKFSSLRHGVSLIPINVNAVQLSSCRFSQNPKSVFTDRNPGGAHSSLPLSHPRNSTIAHLPAVMRDNLQIRRC